MCYFIAHEHLLKEHIYPHTASGDTPVLEYLRLRSHISKLVTSKFFQKWCSRGVVSAFSLRETLDFTGFSRTFKDMHDSITYGIHYRFVLLRVMIHVNMQGQMKPFLRLFGLCAVFTRTIQPPKPAFPE